MKIWLVFFILFLGLNSWSKIDDEVMVRGRLTGFKNDVAFIETIPGNPKSIVKVKKSLLGDISGYVVGKAIITVRSSFYDFQKLNY